MATSSRGPGSSSRESCRRRRRWSSSRPCRPGARRVAASLGVTNRALKRVAPAPATAPIIRAQGQGSGEHYAPRSQASLLASTLSGEVDILLVLVVQPPRVGPDHHDALVIRRQAVVVTQEARFLRVGLWTWHRARGNAAVLPGRPAVPRAAQGKVEAAERLAAIAPIVVANVDHAAAAHRHPGKDLSSSTRVLPHPLGRTPRRAAIARFGQEDVVVVVRAGLHRKP